MPRRSVGKFPTLRGLLTVRGLAWRRPVPSFGTMDETPEEWEAEEVGLLEHGFDCPYCGESITMLVDPSEGDQQYIEDCEVCCNPIGVRLRVSGGLLESFDAAPG